MECHPGAGGSGKQQEAMVRGDVAWRTSLAGRLHAAPAGAGSGGVGSESPVWERGRGFRVSGLGAGAWAQSLRLGRA